MVRSAFDIDIDIPTGVDITTIFPEFVQASRVEKGKLVPHPCGGYFASVPIDPVTGLCATPFGDAEEYGWTKIDFLHLSLLNTIESRDDLLQLVDTEPDWDLLQDPNVVAGLFQLKNSYDFVKQMKPRSVEDLADVIAIIRPEKRHLLDRYVADKNRTRKVLFQIGEEGAGSFKKAHAIAYALMIVLQLNSHRTAIVERSGAILL